MNLGSRIRIAFELAGTSAPAVARATGVPVASINALMLRDSKRSEFTEQICAVLPPERVNVDWVRSGQGTPEPLDKSGRSGSGELKIGVAAAATPSSAPGESVGLAAAPLRSWEYPAILPPGDWVFVPKLGVLHQQASVATNGTIKTIMLHDEIQAYRTHWIREDQLQPAALAWHDVTDDAMTPALFTGDSYVIDTSVTTIVDGRIYALWYGTGIRPRQVFILPNGGLRITATNATFGSLDIAPADVAGLKVLGRLVHRAGRGGL